MKWIIIVSLLIAAIIGLGIVSLKIRESNVELKADKDALLLDKNRLTEEGATLRTDLAGMTANRDALAQEKDRLTEEGVMLRTNLAEMTANRDALALEKDHLTEEGVMLRTDLAEMTASRDALASDKDQLTEEGVMLRTDLAEMTANRDALASDKDQLTEEGVTLRTDLAEMTANRDALALDKDRLTEEGVTLRTGLAKMPSSRDALVDAHGEIEDLLTEIERLRILREPLILETYRTSFGCTGSMEPKLTCLDEATYLTNFQPSEITVGTVISFTPIEECKLDSERVAHRVMEIKIVEGIHYYWPKGDNNRKADNCWIPETLVNGYIIEIYKNVNPERAELRDQINSAWAEYRAVADEYDELLQEHEDICDTRTVEVGRCVLREPYYSQAVALSNRLHLLRPRLNLLNNYLDCLINVARQDQYTGNHCSISSETGE